MFYKVKNVKKKHKYVFIIYTFVDKCMKKNVCKCIRVYYVLWLQ